MTSRVVLKPSVYWSERYGGTWCAELDYISWQDQKFYDTWEEAMDQALYMWWLIQ